MIKKIKKKIAVVVATTMLMMTAVLNVGAAALPIFDNPSTENDGSYENPTIAVEKVTAEPGDTIDVDVTLVNNPGITSMKLHIGFNEKALKLTEVDFNSEQMTGQFLSISDPLESGFVINWMNGFEDISEPEVVYATLKFEVLETAYSGDYDIEIVYNPEDVFNMAVENQTFDVAEGIVTIEGGLVSEDPTNTTSSTGETASEGDSTELLIMGMQWWIVAAIAVAIVLVVVIVVVVVKKNDKGNGTRYGK